MARQRKRTARTANRIRGFISSCCLAWILSPSPLAFAWIPGIQQSPLIRRSCSSSSSNNNSNNNNSSNSNSQSVHRLAATSPENDETVCTSKRVAGVTLKVALDAAGGAADLSEIKSERFTSPESLDMVHRLRRDSDAVLVGRGTVQQDDCSLTVRRVPCTKQPLRVVLDPRLSLLLEQLEEGTSYQLFHDGLPTVVYHSVRDVDYDSLNLLDSVTCIYLPTTVQDNDGLRRAGEYISAKAVVDDLAQRFQVRHLMVEGGPATAKLFLEESLLVDRVILVKAPLYFREPLNAGIASQVLEKARLKLLGTVESGVDRMECWSLSDQPWPSKELGEWP